MTQLIKRAAEKAWALIQAGLQRFCGVQPETAEVKTSQPKPQKQGAADRTAAEPLRRAGKSLRVFGIVLAVAAGILCALFGIRRKSVLRRK
jgi:hypothetical protein